MAFGAIQIKGGVRTVQTPSLNQTGISASNLIRFRDGLVEKMGGWQRFVTAAMGSITRSLHAWRDLTGNNWLGAGNLSSVKIMIGGAVQDITPQTLTSNCAVNVTTTQGSNFVTILDTNVANVAVGSAVFFNTPISVGGIVLAGGMQVVSTTIGTSYTVQSRIYATSTVASGGAVPSFTTTSGSNTVTVTLANHGLTANDQITFPISTVVGGIAISGTYSVLSVLTSSTFTFTAGANAATAATVSMNSGNAQYVYSLVNGVAQTTSSGAIGPIGQFAIGQGFAVTSTVSTQTGAPLVASDWTLDNWGEILLGCPAGGAIWYWPPQQNWPTMLPVGTGPMLNGGIFVAMPAQILVAWGSTASMSGELTDARQDALIVRWSDQLDFTNWTVNSTTQAGSYHIPTGSVIRGAIQGPQQAYIFTDVDCYAMQYIGYPLVFGFTQIGTGCGLVGPHAVTNLYGRTYWMNDTNFFMLGAGTGVQEIPCPVWDTVFQDLDTANLTKCVAAANSQFNEIMFFYPSTSGGTGECDKYAKLNTTTGEWDTGSLARSAWADRSIVGPPIGADPTTTYLQQHETGYSNDGAAMDSYFETGYAAVGDGENFTYLDYFEPDMKWNTVGHSSVAASVSVTLTAAKSPNGETMVSGPLTMTSTTSFLTPRLRGRQVKWRVETNDTTSWWRMGLVRYRFSVDGRR